MKQQRRTIQIVLLCETNTQKILLQGFLTKFCLYEKIIEMSYNKFEIKIPF